MDSAGTVDKLDRVVGFRESVAGDERKKSDGFACASGHLEEAVPSGI